MATDPQPQVAVLGAGITGLTVAWHLKRSGVGVTVFEASPRPGGAIGSWRDDGWLHEQGPNSLLEGSSALAELLAGLGLDARQVLAGPAARNRYLVRGGRLHAAPASPGAFLSTPLFSWRAKLRLLGEPFRGRPPSGVEESVAAFTERRLGREFLDYAVDALVGGVYAGNPARLSVRHGFPKLHALERDHGSLIRGAIALRNRSAGPSGRPLSFPEGLEELPRALAAEVRNGDRSRLWANARVLGVRRLAEGWNLRWQSEAGPEEGVFAAVVSALPSDALAAIALEGVPDAGRLASLRQVVHPPLASVFTGHRREDVAHPLDGFGVLVPSVERRSILGSLFSSTLFPNRAPPGHVALTTFVGGVRQPELAALEDRALLDLVLGDLSALLGVRGRPACVHIRRWSRAIPQYEVGYGRHLEGIAAVEAAAPGLFIGGNCRDGISLANCIESGRRLAAAAGHYVRGAERRPDPSAQSGGSVK